MKSILVTGAFGFLGRNVAKYFKSKGFYVCGIGRGKWLDENEPLLWGIDRWYGDDITQGNLNALSIKPDVIVHCAGGGSVGFSMENPYQDFQNTVNGTIEVLEFIRLSSPSTKLIYPSSPAVLGCCDDLPITTETIGMPVSPYGFHKRMAEDLCLSYLKNFDVNVSIIRFFSIYGNGLTKQLLWDACNKIRYAEEGQSLEFWGTGNETRDWIHVSDAASLIYSVYSQEQNIIINGASGKRYQIKEIIELVAKAMGTDKSLVFNNHHKPGDPKYYWADISKNYQLDWSPTVTVESGIQEYVDWFKTRHD